MPAAQAHIELEAGISEYLSPSLAGFSCRFKERWHDFQVYEIDRSGVELHLSELITPGAVAAELKAASTARREARAALGPSFAPDPTVEEELRAALGSEPLEELWSFLRRQRPKSDLQLKENDAVPEGQTDSKEVEEPPPFVDLNAEAIGNGSKESRKRAHRAILDHFGSLLNTETVETDGGGRRLRVWMRDAELKAKTAVGGTDARKDGGKSNGKDKSKGRSKGKGKGGKGKDKGRNRVGQDDLPADSSGSTQGGGDFGTFRREGWPKDRPDYLYFRLYKENIDTAEAIASIAKCVGRSVKSFTFAGTKDRRASTVQKVCAYRLPADQLRRTLTHRLWDKRLRISDLAYGAERLRLGELQGNLFHVTLRGLPEAAACAGSHNEESSDLDRAFAAVKDGGFLNYFGLQRFGSRKIRTHHVGAALIARQWERAVRLILGDEALIPEGGLRKRPHVSSQEGVSVSSGDDPAPPAKKARLAASDEADTKMEFDTPTGLEGSDSNSASAPGSATDNGKRPKWQLVSESQQLYLKTGDAQAALELMPKSQHLERCILGALARHLSPADSLRQLPHQALALYAHAAQGLVWNAVLSHRVREHGTRPMIGDLVFASDASSASTAASKASADLGAAAVADRGVDEDLDASDFVSLEAADDDVLAQEEGMLPTIRVLETMEEAAKVKFSEVVLPLPGSDVQYPSYLKSTYESVARDLLGLSLADFHESTLVPLRGAYRHASVRPGSMEWRVVQAAQVREAGKKPLMQTDVARLLASRGPVPGTESQTLEDVPLAEELQTQDAPDSTVAKSAIGSEDMARTDAPEAEAAVVFSCSLPPSAYLTMLLREVSKHVVE